jgi:hypothetical protein
MNVFTKNVRKLMGWCPNAKVTETGSRIINANFEANDSFCATVPTFAIIMK